MVRCQHNAWIHLVATAMVIAAGFFFHLSPPEWCWIVLAVSIVWTAEALNTAFEFLADAASPNFHPVVRDAKDVAAGAVLITALASSVIGAIIFLARCEGPVRPLTRSTHTEIFVMSSEYAIPTHLLLFSRQTNS